MKPEMLLMIDVKGKNLLQLKQSFESVSASVISRLFTLAVSSLNQTKLFQTDCSTSIDSAVPITHTIRAIYSVSLCIIFFIYMFGSATRSIPHELVSENKCTKIISYSASQGTGVSYFTPSILKSRPCQPAAHEPHAVLPGFMRPSRKYRI